MSISELKHMPEQARRIEVFTGVGRRRRWSREDKAAIVAESYGEGETVCGVARRHGLTPQQLFNWRRLARDADPSRGSPMFVPAVLASGSEPVAPLRRACPRSAVSGIEFEVDGVAVRVGPDADPGTIAAVIRALKVCS